MILCPVEYSYNPKYTQINPVEYNKVAITLLNPSYPYCSCGNPGGAHKFISNDATVKEPIRILSIDKLACTWRTVYKVVLDRKDAFTPGDAIGLITPNSAELVDELMKLCGIEDGLYQIERSGKSAFSYEGSIRDFFIYKYDLTSLPKKIHLLNLAKTSEMREHVEYLCSKEGVRDYMRLGAAMNNLVEIIHQFKCRPTIDDLARNCDFIKPRYYSLMNRQDKNHEIIVGEISRTLGDCVKFGHTSGYIKRTYGRMHDISTERCIHKSTCAEYLRHNKNIEEKMGTTALRYVSIEPIKPCDSLGMISAVYRKNALYGRIQSRQLISFCTGTGIAPFVAHYNHRPQNQELILVYGYRNDEDDLSRDLALDCKVYRAKSSEGRYVTDFCTVIEEYKDTCSVFICGNMAMQKDTFERICALYPAIVEGNRVFFDNWQ